MDWKAIEKGARRLHANAVRQSTCKVNGVTYTLDFNTVEGIYVVTDPDGKPVTRFNTRKISVAKQWLREYFE